MSLCCVLGQDTLSAQPKKTGNRPDMTEKNVVWDVKHQQKQMTELADRLICALGTFYDIIIHVHVSEFSCITYFVK